MLIPIEKITVAPGRREAKPEAVQELADSIYKVGLLNPITIDRGYSLIAGLHRLEAAKLLEWTEIECVVSGLEGLEAELAEIDENIVRKGISGLEYNDLLLRRKEIYEAIYPETRQGMRNGQTSKNRKLRFLEPKPFAQDTAEKTGVSRSTVERQIQAAKNMTSDAKEILNSSGKKITKQSALKLSRLPPCQQSEAANQLAMGIIKSIDQFNSSPAEPQAGKKAAEPEVSSLPFGPVGKTFSSFEESVADLKDPNKDCSCTTDSFLVEITSFSRNFCKDIQWYSTPYYEAVFPSLTAEQIKYMGQQMENICQAAKNLYKFVKGTKTNELSKKDKPGKAAAYD